MTTRNSYESIKEALMDFIADHITLTSDFSIDVEDAVDELAMLLVNNLPEPAPMDMEELCNIGERFYDDPGF